MAAAERASPMAYSMVWIIEQRPAVMQPKREEPVHSAKIAEAREFANRLRDCLPSSVDVAGLGVRSKAPFNLICAKEALIWRTEELTRGACDALEREDLAVAAILTRAIIESAALAWKLMELLDDRHRHSPGELNGLILRGLLGSKQWEDMPPPFQILGCIDRMNKKVPGVRASYDSLSEIAHPNWRGVLGMYSKTDSVNFITHFGRGLRGTESTVGNTVNAMLGALSLFEFAYHKIATNLPVFLTELESLWSEEKGAQPE